MPYARSDYQRHHDLAASREFESIVRDHLPAAVIDKTESTTELDFFLPHLYIEVKEKRQSLTARWHLLPEVPERDLFVIDELSVRKALVHAPYSYFVLHDVPGGDRIFLASAMEMACADRVRRQRVGKGKHIIRLDQFRRVTLPSLTDAIAADVAAMSWKQSACMGLIEVEQV